MNVEPVVLSIATIALLFAPHLIPQRRLRASSGIALWMAVLTFRAAVAVSLVVVIVFVIPATQLFSLLTHWCLHAVVPFFASHLGFDGHAVGDAAVLVPVLVLAVSLISVGIGTWRGARAVRRWLKRSSLGAGPGSSLIIGEADVVVAAAGLRAPRLVVSAGALLKLDDAELTAGLEHERGHVIRRHRFISLAAHCCHALSRVLPGGKAALVALQFHLERDADDYAVRQTGDPLALASAICKAAGARTLPVAEQPALANLADGGVPARLDRLVASSSDRDSRLESAIARVLTSLMVVLSVGLLWAVPAAAGSGLDRPGPATDSTACD